MFSNNFLKSLSHYSDSDFHQRLGIRNWSQRLFSYNELLYRHNSLVYDDQGIFLLDRISILFRCRFDHEFFKNPMIYRDQNFPNRYMINDQVTLIQLPKNDDTYLESYSVVFNEILIGVLNCRKTTRRDQVKFKFNNEFLYTRPLQEIVYSAMYVADLLDFSFVNYSDYEIAYDSLTNFLDRVLLTFYQSTECQQQVHTAHGSQPIYRVKGSKRHIQQITDGWDKTKGTYTEGSKKSDTQAKIYDKSYELAHHPKPYISEIHEKHFGLNAHVYRVEMSAKSPAFYDNGVLSGIDLLDLLDSGNFMKYYQQMLGDKLVYRSIKPTGYDGSRNPIYEEIRLLVFPPVSRLKKVKVNPSNQHKLHDRNANRFKQLLNGFLDDDFGFCVILKYLRSKRSTVQYSDNELISGLMLCERRYENPISNTKIRELITLGDYLHGRLNYLQRTYYLARILFA